MPQGPADYQESRPPAAARQAPAQAQSRPATAAQRPAAAPGAGIPAPTTNLGGYTQAARYGDLLFVSGQIAIDPATNQLKGSNVEEQTRAVMENIRAILEAHRLTMANVVSATVYLKDLQDFRAMDEAYESYFRGNLPARSVVQVTRLPRDALVEISVIAGR